MMCRCPSTKPGMSVIPRASICLMPAGAAVPAPTEAIRPLRTTTVPESMTVPLPTMMRALEMTRSCAPASHGGASDASIINTRTSSLFMARGYAVRFCFVYFALWSAATQVLGGLLLTPFGGTGARSVVANEAGNGVDWHAPVRRRCALCSRQQWRHAFLLGADVLDRLYVCNRGGSLVVA